MGFTTLSNTTHQKVTVTNLPKHQWQLTNFFPNALCTNNPHYFKFAGHSKALSNVRIIRNQIQVVITPPPGRGTGYCFLAISFFLSLSATLRENGWNDLHEIFREGVEWSWDDLITFSVNSGQRSIFLLSPTIAQRTGVNKSVSFARRQQGWGLLCLAPQIVMSPHGWNMLKMF